MKRLTVLVLALCLLLAAGAAHADKVASEFSEGLAWFEQGGKYGYINTKGDTVFPAIWDNAWNFDGGYATVRNGKSEGRYSWGIIDKKGNYLVPLEKCDSVALYRDQQIICVTYMTGMAFGVEYRTMDGKKIGRFDNSRDNGFPYAVQSGKRWGYVSREGKLVLPFIYEDAFNFSGGLALVIQKNAKGATSYDYINMDGEVVLRGDWTYATPFPEDGSPTVVSKSGKYGYLTTDGTMLTDYVWDNASAFRNGRAAVATTNVKGQKRWGFLDETGALAIPQQWDFVFAFAGNGLARVYIGEVTSSWGPKPQIGGFYGLIDTQGNYVVAPDRWNDMAGFDMEGLAKVGVLGEDGVIRYGYIDAEGKVVVEPVWEALGSFREDVCWVKRDGKYGYIDRSGEIVLPLQWERVGNFNSGVAIVHDSSTWYIIDHQGNVIF